MEPFFVKWGIQQYADEYSTGLIDIELGFGFSIDLRRSLVNRSP